MKTPQMIHNCIKEYTITFFTDGTVINTDEIAKKVNISRGVTSKYLNELVKEQSLVKISTRPVIFLDRNVIEKTKGITLEEFEFLSIGEFINFIEKKSISDERKNVIGYKSSLNEAVIKLKANIKYPNENGGAVILAGEKGTGKKFLAKYLFNYAKNNELIEKDRKFYVLNCLRSETDYSKILLGKNLKDKNETGYLERANGSILYIKDAHNLDLNSQNELATYLENGYINSTSERNVMKINVRIILATTEDPQEVFCERILDDIAQKVVLPPIESRTQREKEEFVHKFLSEEADKLSKEIYISNYAYNALVRFEYANNIEGIINAVKATCTNANYSQLINSKKIEIYLYHLPEDIMRLCMDEDVSEDKHMMNLEEIKSNFLFDNIMFYYDDIINRYQDFRNGTYGEKEFINLTHETINKYCDYIVFGKNPYNLRTETYKNIIENIFTSISDKHQVVIYANCAFLISEIIYKLTYADDWVLEWEVKNQFAIEDIINLFTTKYRNEYFVAQEIAEMIFKTLDIKLNSITLLILILNIHFYNKKGNKNEMLGLVIAHGYSTASSITDSVNKFLGKSIFRAIDMPFDKNVEYVVSMVKRFIFKLTYYNDIILLVDMESLEEIGSLLLGERKVRIGIINNISTRVVLDVGNKMLQGMDMETILSSACEDAICKYRVFENKKKDAIIFTTETGALSTERVIDVFKASIPKNVDIHFIPYDYYKLLKVGKSGLVFQEYNVLLITGTIKINIENIPYMAIEDVIAFKDIGKLNEIFSRFLDEQEVKVFNSNLLKNFSLENIMQSLTILNASLLLEYIERALNNLRHDLTITMSNKIVLRLYIHISTLIERLVTKEQMLEYPELEDFQQRHSQFIDSFQRSFREVCKKYNIEIPLSEIAYLYDYIFEDCI